MQKHSPEVFCKKGVLKNFANFTGKYLCWSLFFNKAAVLQPASFLKETPTQVLSCEVCETFKNEEHLQTTASGGVLSCF